MTNDTLELQTDRLTLKVLGPAFAPQVLDYFVRNQAFLKEWNPAVGDDFYTLPFQEQKLQAELEEIGAGRMLRLWLFKRDDLRFERAIGSIGFNNIVRGAFQSCHLGYQIDGQEMNKGLITEALQRAIRFMFDEWRLHRIEANIMPRNARSRRVVEKLGFVEEGLAKKYLKINGAWEDHIHYVMFNPALE
jgi:[ribosomal protein S5]-alanine N-acetyltransferase